MRELTNREKKIIYVFVENSSYKNLDFNFLWKETFSNPKSTRGAIGSLVKKGILIKDTAYIFKLDKSKFSKAQLSEISKEVKEKFIYLGLI